MAAEKSCFFSIAFARPVHLVTIALPLHPRMCARISDSHWVHSHKLNRHVCVRDFLRAIWFCTSNKSLEIAESCFLGNHPSEINQTLREICRTRAIIRAFFRIDGEMLRREEWTSMILTNAGTPPSPPVVSPVWLENGENQSLLHAMRTGRLTLTFD